MFLVKNKNTTVKIFTRFLLLFSFLHIFFPRSPATSLVTIVVNFLIRVNEKGCGYGQDANTPRTWNSRNPIIVIILTQDTVVSYSNSDRRHLAARRLSIIITRPRALGYKREEPRQLQTCYRVVSTFAPTPFRVSVVIVVSDKFLKLY